MKISYHTRMKKVSKNQKKKLDLYIKKIPKIFPDSTQLDSNSKVISIKNSFNCTNFFFPYTSLTPKILGISIKNYGRYVKLESFVWDFTWK